MDLEKEIKSRLKNKEIDSKDLREIFVEFVKENHEPLSPLDGLKKKKKKKKKGKKALEEFRKSWLELEALGEDLDGGVPFEDNPQQRMWDSFGDVWGNMLCLELDLNDLTKTREDKVFKDFCEGFQELIRNMSKINETREILYVENSLLCFESLIKISRKLLKNELN